MSDFIYIYMYTYIFVRISLRATAAASWLHKLTERRVGYLVSYQRATVFYHPPDEHFGKLAVSIVAQSSQWKSDCVFLFFRNIKT